MAKTPTEAVYWLLARHMNNIEHSSAGPRLSIFLLLVAKIDIRSAFSSKKIVFAQKNALFKGNPVFIRLDK
jgi:hypothetical protein